MRGTVASCILPVDIACHSEIGNLCDAVGRLVREETVSGGDVAMDEVVVL